MRDIERDERRRIHPKPPATALDEILREKHTNGSRRKSGQEKAPE
jgi:hypothetical protein